MIHTSSIQLFAVFRNKKQRRSTLKFRFIGSLDPWGEFQAFAFRLDNAHRIMSTADTNPNSGWLNLRGELGICITLLRTHTLGRLLDCQLCRCPPSKDGPSHCPGDFIRGLMDPHKSHIQCSAFKKLSNTYARKFPLTAIPVGHLYHVPFCRWCAL